MPTPRLVTFALLVAILTPSARPDVSLPSVFSDHMVLQRDRPIAVWGRADPGEKVGIRFAGQKARTRADASGHWHAQLRPVSASSAPREFVVRGANTIIFRDVLVGDVWLCAGQSNMEMKVGVATPGAKPESAYDPALAAELPTATYPQLRLLRLDKNWDTGEVAYVGWSEARGESLAQFSAVGFFFGRELHQTLGVPVGLIQSAVGGSRLEEWISDEAYAALEPILAADTPPRFERDAAFVSRNYDRMIAPLAPFGLRGVIWYQGESNLIGYHDGLRYADKFAALVAHWRGLWRHPEMPIYSVQIAPFAYSERKRDKLSHAPDELPELWEAQQLATTIPHTGLVPIADTVADVHNIHPGGKAIVGHRLAALALSATYGRHDRVATGSTFDRAEIHGHAMVIHFKNAEGGLMTRDGAAADGFELAGADGRFCPAIAEIQGDSIRVTADDVPTPMFVRFSWHETARPNLMNRAGWPAYPFRSDAPTWVPPKALDAGRFFNRSASSRSSRERAHRAGLAAPPTDPVLRRWRRRANLSSSREYISTPVLRATRRSEALSDQLGDIGPVRLFCAVIDRNLQRGLQDDHLPTPEPKTEMTAWRPETNTQEPTTLPNVRRAAAMFASADT